MLTKDRLLSQVKKQIKEVDIHQVKDEVDQSRPLTLVDIRELDEVTQGFIPGAKHIPRGFLELRIEDAQPHRDGEIVLYCAGGVRSVLAARSLQEMGYTNVSSMIGGFGAWKNAGYKWMLPRHMTDEQRTRYSRHILIPEVGEEGQFKLFDARVLLIGAGGLGSPAAVYLAAAGVGTIGIVDFDTVDLSNLQRQILHHVDDIGRPKVDSAADAIHAMNPDVKVIKHAVQLSSENAKDILKDYDVILNGSDNFPTRYLVNDAAAMLGKPLVDASIFQFEGQLTVYHTDRGGPCYRCLYPTPPPPGEVPSCAEGGVLGVLPGVIGSLQAVEAIKLVLGVGDPLIGRLMLYDALSGDFSELKLPKNPDCPVCGEDPSITELIDYDEFCGMPSSRTHAHQVMALA
jgi:adenylyltransferase/sulfurtransferase